MKISAKMRKPGTLLNNAAGEKASNRLIAILMRLGLTIVFLLTSFQVLLALSAKGQSISTEQVQVGLQNEDLLTGLKKIEQQTPLRFIYRKANLKYLTNLTLPLQTRSVENTLHELLDNTAFTFRQLDNKILLELRSQDLEYAIKGRVVGVDHRPVAFATVNIAEAGINKVIQSTQTDTSGNFQLSVTKSGQYILRISSVGMDSLAVEVTLGDILAIRIPDLTMMASSKELKEVVITGKKPLIEQKIDRTVLNVESSILAHGRSALDVLQNAPGVIVDNQNDNIKLNNNSGVTIMIDGRKTYLSASDLNNMLRNMSSEQISTIEIITNPSAKYDASGTAGIIDIKLKKNKFYGANGSVSAMISEGIVPYYSGDLSREAFNINFNNRTDKTNFYLNLNPNRNLDYSQTALFRTVNFQNSSTTFNEFNTNPRKGSGISGRVGLDYNLSKNTTIGFLLEGQLSQNEIDGLSKTNVAQLDSGVQKLSSITENSIAKSPGHNVTANINLNHSFNDKGTSLSFDATYSGYRNEKNQNFNTSFFNEHNTLTADSLNRNLTEANINIFTSKADFTAPVSKSLRFDAGLKSDYVSINNNDNFDQFIEGAWQNNPKQSNIFIYKENVNAAYVNLDKKWAKWEIQAGLRAEDTHSTGNSITTNEVTKNNYLLAFPSIFVSEKIDQNSSIRYSYSRRIDRPNYQQLNPFVFYVDPYTILQGNPYLKPQLSDSYQIAYTYKRLILTLGYLHTSDYILQLSEQDDTTKVIKAIQGNFGSHKGYRSNISFPFDVSHWWSAQSQLSIYFDQYNNITPTGSAYVNEKLAYNFNILNSYTLSDTWSAEWSFFYISPFSSGIERTTKPRYDFNAGIQKSLFNKRGRLSFNIRDIFLTDQYTGVAQYQNTDLNVINKWASRSAALSFSYSFGKQTVKAPRDRKTGAETLKNRTN